MMRILVALALVANGAALFNKAPASVPKKAGARKAPAEFGRVVPTGRGAALVVEADPIAEVAEVAKDVAITSVRLGTCALMVHHGLDKIANVDGAHPYT